MKHSFIFNGKSSLDYGIIIATHPESRHAERRGSTSTIPGRHGALLRDEAAFSTYEISYDVLLDARNVGDMYHLGRDLSAWLLTASGFCRLEDTYEPEHYRMARYVGSPDVANILFKFGRAELEFEVQPQRYLKSGEREITLPSGEGVIYNPTAFEARPLIKITAQPRDAVIVPREVELQWVEDQAIAGKVFNNAYLPNPYLNNYEIYNSTPEWVNYLSRPIDVEGCTSAIISTAQTYKIYGISNSFLCYTFVDADGKPVGISEHNYSEKLERAEIPIPSDAKYLYIAAQKVRERWTVEPSVTIIPPPEVPYSDSTVTINGTTIHIQTKTQATVFLDCDRHDAYFPNGDNANNFVSFEEAGNRFPTFPELSPGENAIVVASETTISATIVPRWWML